MELQISDEARRAAAQCRHGISCLTGGKDLCAVESCVNGTLYFVNCRHDGDCAFLHFFGMGRYCTCPVRKELFDKYGI